jgi:hypothetical protein
LAPRSGALFVDNLAACRLALPSQMPRGVNRHRLTPSPRWPARTAIAAS